MQHVSSTAARAAPAHLPLPGNPGVAGPVPAEAGCETLFIGEPPRVEAQQKLLALRAFDFKLIPDAVIKAALAPQLDLEPHLVLGSTSRSMGALMDEAGARSPILASYYALKLAPTRRDALRAVIGAAENRAADPSWNGRRLVMFDALLTADRNEQAARFGRELFVASRVCVRNRKAATTAHVPSICLHLDARMAKAPYDVSSFVEAAGWLMRWQQPLEAKKILLRCAELAPLHLGVRTQLGRALWQLGEHDASIEASTSGLGPKPLGADGQRTVFAMLMRGHGELAYSSAHALDDESTASFVYDVLEARASPDSVKWAIRKWCQDVDTAARMPAAIGDANLTFEMLETLVPSPFWKDVMDELALPLYDPFRADPRLNYLIERIGPDIQAMKAIRLSIPDAFFGPPNEAGPDAAPAAAT